MQKLEEHIYLTSYGYHDSYNRQLGITYYDEDVWPEKEGINQIQTYYVKLAIKNPLSDLGYSMCDIGYDRHEIFSVFITENISNFIFEEKVEDDGEFDSYKQFDFIKLLNKHYPNLISFHLERFKRKNSGIVKETYNDKNKVYLEVDHNSDFYRNYEFDGKEYCGLYIHYFEPKNYKFEITIDSSEFSRKKISDSIEILKREAQKLEEGWYDTAPYIIKLYGSKTCSWSKPFYSSEELNEELDFLKKMQPISKQYDLICRGYHYD